MLELTARTAYPAIAPGARVRIEEMGEHLRRHGVRVQFQPSLTDDEYITITAGSATGAKLKALGQGLLRASRPDAQDGLRLVHRLRFLLPSPLDLHHRIDVYDFDDAIYLPRRKLPDAPRMKLESARAVRHLRGARLVLAGNSILADEASRHASRVEVVPSCVDAATPRARRQHEVEVMTVGWTGSPSTARYLYEVMPSIGRAVAAGVSMRLVVMGARAGPTAPWIEYRGWTPEAERRLLEEIDVGIMPLPDDEWTRGKCGYKLLRYFASGLPTIASPVGVNSALLADQRGIPAGSATEWRSALSVLASDAVMRQEMGDRARAFAAREYSFDVWAPRVANLLNEMART